MEGPAFQTWRSVVPIIASGADLAPEKAIGEDKVDDRQHDPDAPPDQPNRQAVETCGSVEDRQAIGGVDSGQHVGVDAEG